MADVKLAGGADTSKDFTSFFDTFKEAVDVLGSSVDGAAAKQIAGTLGPNIFDSDLTATTNAVISGALTSLPVLSLTKLFGAAASGGIFGLAVGASAIFSLSKRSKEKELALKKKTQTLNDLIKKYAGAIESREKLLHSAGLSGKLANIDAVGLGLKRLEGYNRLGTNALKENAKNRQAENTDLAGQYVFEVERQIKELSDIEQVLKSERTNNPDELEFILESTFKAEKGDL